MGEDCLPWRVNPDYEAVLFGGTASSQVSESLEFLAWFLEDAPIFTNKKYSSEYLNHVENISSHNPKTVDSGAYRNWWGALEDVARERVLNSKLTSTKLLLQRDTRFQAQIISDPSELQQVSLPFPWLIKQPNSMAGRGFQRVHSLEEIRVPKKMSSLVVEPLLLRTHDFSHFFYSTGEEICYENLVDQSFQYRGTIFSDWKNPTRENLSFHSEVGVQEWDRFQEIITLIKKDYEELAHGLKHQIGFSLDSFIYTGEKGPQIHSASEINFRRTMGSVAWALARRYARNNSWVTLRLEKPHRGGFKNMQTKLQAESLEQNILLLSPGDTRFDVYFLMAKSSSEGELLNQRLLRLLTDA